MSPKYVPSFANFAYMELFNHHHVSMGFSVLLHGNFVEGAYVSPHVAVRLFVANFALIHTSFGHKCNRQIFLQYTFLGVGCSKGSVILKATPMYNEEGVEKTIDRKECTFSDLPRRVCKKNSDQT